MLIINESKFLDKIENDVYEKLYELLVIHLTDIDKKVSTSVSNKENQDRLVELLDKAIVDAQRVLKPFDKLRYYRFILIFCNRILRYRKDRTDLKNLKNKLIEDFTHSESKSVDKIPTKNQINEVRLTFDADYLIYKIKNCMDTNRWNEALYFITAVNLLEPDYEKIEEFYKTIKSNLKDKELVIELNYPENKDLVLDANTIIDEIKKESFSSKFSQIIENNTLWVTNSTIKELNEHIDVLLIEKERAYKKNNNLSGYDKEVEALNKKYESTLSKFKKIDIISDDSVKKNIIKFYSQYPNKMEELTLSKIQTRLVSHKLRKLSQREYMLPEEGDITLLAEVIQINKTGKNLGIYSFDHDFVDFTKPLKEEFGVDIFTSKQIIKKSINEKNN